jgi:hypothetical protein
MNTKVGGQQQMRVYHFLPERWAIEDLVKKRLKVSLLDDLNDPFELKGKRSKIQH